MVSSLKDRLAGAGVPVSRVREFLPRLVSVCTVKQIRSVVQQFLTPHRGAGWGVLFSPGSPHTATLHWGQGCCYSNMDFECGSGDKQFI